MSHFKIPTFMESFIYISKEARGKSVHFHIQYLQLFHQRKLVYNRFSYLGFAFDRLDGFVLINNLVWVEWRV
jgi:hypothetical protein